MAASSRALSSIIQTPVPDLPFAILSQAHHWSLRSHPLTPRLTRAVQLMHDVRTRVQASSSFPEDRAAATLGRDPEPSRPSDDIVLLKSCLRFLSPRVSVGLVFPQVLRLHEHVLINVIVTASQALPDISASPRPRNFRLTF